MGSSAPCFGVGCGYLGNNGKARRFGEIKTTEGYFGIFPLLMQCDAQSATCFAGFQQVLYCLSFIQNMDHYLQRYYDH